MPEKERQRESARERASKLCAADDCERLVLSGKLLQRDDPLSYSLIHTHKLTLNERAHAALLISCSRLLCLYFAFRKLLAVCPFFLYKYIRAFIYSIQVCVWMCVLYTSERETSSVFDCVCVSCLSCLFRCENQCKILYIHTHAHSVRISLNIRMYIKIQ